MRVQCESAVCEYSLIMGSELGHGSLVWRWGPGLALGPEFGWSVSIALGPKLSAVALVWRCGRVWRFGQCLALWPVFCALARVGRYGSIVAVVDHT